MAQEATESDWGSLSAINYDMPPFSPSQPPERDWTIDPSRCVLLIHDMQRYFLRKYAAEAEPAITLERNVGRLLDAARRTGMRVAYTAQPGSMTPSQRGLLADFWGPGMRMSHDDRDIVDSLRPEETDWELTKWRYSAFIGTGLRERMEAEARTQLVVTGIYGHVGVLASAVEAYSSDIETFLVGDAIGDFSSSDHSLTLDLAAKTCAAVVATDEALDQIAAEPALSEETAS